MPYYLILSVFGAALFSELCVLCVCAAIPALRRAVPYGWRVALGSFLGFVGANLVSLLVGLVPVLVASGLRIDRDAPGARIVAGFVLAGLFIGPLIVSPLGFLTGAWLGWKRARRVQHA